MARLASRSCTCALLLALAVAHLAISTQPANALSLTTACKKASTCTTFSALSDATPVSWTVDAAKTEQVVVVRFAGLFTANVTLGTTPLTPLETNMSSVYGIVPATGGSLTFAAYSTGVPVVYSITVYPRVVVKASAQATDALAGFAKACCTGVDTPACKAVAAPDSFCSYGANACSATGDVTHLLLPGGAKCGKSWLQTMSIFDSLKTLDLSRCGVAVSATEFFTGLFSMPGLMHIHMAGNQLSGAIPDDTLGPILGGNEEEADSPPVPITTVDLSSNLLTGNLSQTLVGLPTVMSVNMANNMFIGDVPAVPQAETGLAPMKVMDLSNNRLTGSTGADFLSAALMYLDVSNNALSTSLPKTVPTSLVYYDVHNNTMGYNDFLKTASQLVFLNVSNNILNGFVDSLLPTTPKALAVFSAVGSQIQGTVPVAMANISTLRFVDLNSNQLRGDLDAFAGALPASNKIHHFNVSDNTIQGGLSSKLQTLAAFSAKELPPKVTFSDSAPPTQSTAVRVFDVSGNTYMGGEYPLWMANSAATLSESYRAQGIDPTQVIMFQTAGGKLVCPAANSGLDAQGVIAIQNLGFTCYDEVNNIDIGLQDSLYKLVPGLPAPPPPPIKYIGKAPPSKSDKKWKIMGIVLGVLFALALVAAAVFMYKWRDLDLKMKQRYHKQTGDDFKQNYVVSPKTAQNGDVEHGADQNNIQ